MSLPLTAASVPSELARMIPGVALYRLGDCAVLLSRDEIPGLIVAPRWHLSISHAKRYPTWAEIGEARDRLLPVDICFCIPFPPRAWWLSVHPNCFHLWEIRDHDLVETWRLDGEEAARRGFGKPQPERVG